MRVLILTLLVSSLTVVAQVKRRVGATGCDSKTMCCTTGTQTIDGSKTFTQPTVNISTALQRFATLAADAPVHQLFRARGTSVSPAVVQSGDSVGSLSMAGYYDPASAVPVVKITGEVTATCNTSTCPGDLVFYTNPAGNVASSSADKTIERVRIKGSGELVVAATTSPAITLAGGGIQFNGNANYLSTGTTGSTLTWGGIFSATGTVFSSVGSGSVAFYMSQGAKLCTNGAGCTRYFSDDGTSVTVSASTRATGYVYSDHSLQTPGYVTSTGAITTTGSYIRPTRATLQTCSSSIEGAIMADSTTGAATGFRSKMCHCTSDGSSVYAWQNLVNGNTGSTTSCPL